MPPPPLSDMGVAAAESSAYGRCSCASTYDDSTSGFLSPYRRPFFQCAWWLLREFLRYVNGLPGRLELACRSNHLSPQNHHIIISVTVVCLTISYLLPFFYTPQIY
jgi:hypothetical protein